MSSLTFDKWTSTKNRRYMNINIHLEKDFWNLGLCRVTGSMPAEKCVDILEHKLLEFNVSLKDIFFYNNGRSCSKEENWQTN